MNGGAALVETKGTVSELSDFDRRVVSVDWFFAERAGRCNGDYRVHRFHDVFFDVFRLIVTPNLGWLRVAIPGCRAGIRKVRGSISWHVEPEFFDPISGGQDNGAAVSQHVDTEIHGLAHDEYVINR